MNVFCNSLSAFLSAVPSSKLIRLGIAQVDQGKYADAQANFAKVTDARAPIAQLWSAYAKNKIAGK